MSCRADRNDKRTLFSSTAFTIVFTTTMLTIASLLCMYIAVKLFA